MRVVLTSPIDGLTVGQEYRVAVVHYEGYELMGYDGRYAPEAFEVISTPPVEE